MPRARLLTRAYGPGRKTNPRRAAAVFGFSGPAPPCAPRARPAMSPVSGSRTVTFRALGPVPPGAVLAARPDSGRHPTRYSFSPYLAADQDDASARRSLATPGTGFNRPPQYAVSPARPGLLQRPSTTRHPKHGPEPPDCLPRLRHAFLPGSALHPRSHATMARHLGTCRSDDHQAASLTPSAPLLHHERWPQRHHKGALGPWQPWTTLPPGLPLQLTPHPSFARPGP